MAKQDPFVTICEKVGICVSKDLARKAVLELLPCIGRSERDAVRAPHYTAAEITEYLDDIARNP